MGVSQLGGFGGGGDIWREEDVVEDGVDNFPAGREIEAIGIGSDFFNEFEGTVLFVVKFLVRASEHDVEGFKPDLIASLVSWAGFLLSIVILLHVFHCHIWFWDNTFSVPDHHIIIST